MSGTSDRPPHRPPAGDTGETSDRAPNRTPKGPPEGAPTGAPRDPARRRREPLGARLFRALLALYPGAFRDEYGRELSMVLADRARDAPTSWGRARVWLEAAGGVLAHAPREHLEMLRHDLRDAYRAGRRHPVFAATVIVTLALGIGATTAVFSLVRGVLLRPLPYAAPDRIVTIAESARANDVATRNDVAPANFLDWRSRSRAFARIGAWTTTLSFNLSAPGEPERVVGAAMSSEAFTILGVQPALGRAFRADDDLPGATRVILISAPLWQRRFQRDPALLGQPVVLNGEPAIVIGVMPAGFRFPERGVDLWIPLERHVSAENMRWRGSHYLSVLARLRDDVTIEQARAEMNGIAAHLKREHTRFTMGEGAVVLPLHDDIVRDVRRVLLLLFGATGLVLLIACANVANLWLVRAVQRLRELSLRRALGAGDWRIARQLIVESTALTLIGGTLGVIVAKVARDAIVALAPPDLPFADNVPLDGPVLAASLGIALACGLVFGLAPMLAAHGRGARDGSRAGTRALGPMSGLMTGPMTRSGAYASSRSVLVVAEVALSLVLVMAAGLLIRSFVRLQGEDPGYRAPHVMTARVSLSRASYDANADVTRFYDRLLDALGALPGVERVAAITDLPLTGHQFDNSFAIEGRPTPPGQDTFALVRGVSPGYFDLFGLPVRRGRAFTDRDRADTPPVIVISESMARRYWPGEDPIGKRMTVHMGAAPPLREIVGVVADARTEVQREPEPTMYLPYRQQLFRSMVVAVHATASDGQTVQAMRQALQRLDPHQPIYQVRTLDALTRETLAPWRFSMVLLTTFASLALVLAGVGLCGVVSRLVTERMAEIGLRMALGARPGDVVAMVLRHSLRLVALGVVLGCAGALLTTRLLASMLYETAPMDPGTLVTAVATLSAIAAVAAAGPALRAARVDPLVALRGD